MTVKKNIKNKITIDINLDRDPQLKVEKLGEDNKYIYGEPKENFEQRLNMDLETLSEGILALIRFGKDYKIFNDHVTFRKVIEHLEEGFIDPEYETRYVLGDEGDKD